MDFNLGNFGRSLGFSSVGFDRGWSMPEAGDHEQGEVDFGGWREVLTDDVLGELPEDPFSMNIKSTFKTAISGWFGENQPGLGSDSGQSLESDKPIGGDQMIFKSLNWVCSGTIVIKQVDSAKTNDMPMPFSGSRRYELNDRSVDCDSVSDGEKSVSVACGDEGHGEGPCEPHEAFVFVLSYLDLEDLLAVEGVCRSLRDAVRSDPFFWKTISIDFPLSERITDDSLLKLTCKAQGNLQCLSLVGCMGITNDGLMQVLRSNPRLTKLSIPGCVRLSAEGILSIFRALKSWGILGLKSFRTGGAFGFTTKQFKELSILLGADDNTDPRFKMPRFYGANQPQISFEDGRVIDLEICPICKKPSLVYDCPAKTCKAKDPSSPSSCRACIICIERCFSCGRCINDCEFEEMFCLAFSCLVCSKQMLMQREKVETSSAAAASSSSPRSSQEIKYQFCFYG